MKCFTFACAVASFACIVASFASPRAVGAQAARVSVLDLPGGARALGTAMTGTAGVRDPSDAVFNPALAATATGVHYTSAYANWTGDVDYFANTVAVGGGNGSARAGLVVAHRRLDFKAYDAANDFFPNNNQASYMTGAAAMAWNGPHGTVGAGAALSWDTSGPGEGPTLAGAGVRAEAPGLERGRFRFGAALGWSALDLGAGDERADPNPASHFTTRAARERHRAGVTVRAAIARADNSSAEVVSAAMMLDILGIAGTGDAIDASAAGVEVTVAGTVSLCAGTADAMVAGRHALTLGAGVGRSFGAFTCRADYARVETRDDALAANAFGVHLSMSF
jgi:hypothetical protein